MQKTMKFLGNSAKRVVAVVPVLAIVAAVAIPASAGAESSFSSGLSLVFAGGKAHAVADNVAVPVECVGSGSGYCSGEVTLSRKGHRISIPVSVRGGGQEVVMVPLRVGSTKSHPRKVHGVAVTTEPLGGPVTTAEYLYAE
jgi:hypothetical protein